MQLNIDADPLRIADDLDDLGVVCVPGAVSKDWLERARTDVQELLAAEGERNHFIRSPETLAMTDIIQSDNIIRLLEDVVRARFPAATADARLIGSALRVIAGPSESGDAWWYHYDANIVTMIVPIVIPDAGRGNSGELVGFFNKRPFRRFAFANILGKAFSQSRYYRWAILRRPGKPHYGRVIDMSPGNVYVLWGYRSLHANMPCRAGALRATLLLHFGEVHGSSRALTTAVRMQELMRTA
ncbi:hypothetical protein SAMN04489835_3889 [Mycolicibacterium rutilum]|uniref:Phytanoyl-CoA dioxygenase (PhyH) n=1 Tax=Mycolicibacterium rutilum TaxID=370526 RepID=A0A1H6KMW3_MYCRU|nr:hypothetical protein [Mycolicibacterium rutilum]SEH76864.1 hypothetical protein SAMN04489835_3889 [Mycolicibacterium rutilum]